tara:strand:+ start:93 stop:452 length:360 start_codon:yes stop_codon:yes gene_type:complete
MLESYIVQLPDGSEGNLLDFYNGIMDESITATDEGYILSDGSIVPTNGEAMWNPDADVLIALMSPYIVGDSGESDNDDIALDEDTDNDDSSDSEGNDKGMIKYVIMLGVGYLLYKEFGN